MLLETWMPVPEYEGLYEISDLGNVLSLRTGKLLSQHPKDKRTPHLKVRLCRDRVGVTKLVHQLVLLAFVGPPSDGEVARHLDDVPTNNSLRNLAYGTRSDNAYDSVRNGTHAWSSREYCSRGHRLGGDNVWPSSGSKRICKKCHQLAQQRRNRKDD